MVKKDKFLPKNCSDLAKRHSVSSTHIEDGKDTITRAAVSPSACVEAHARQRMLCRVAGGKFVLVEFQDYGCEVYGGGKSDETLQFEIGCGHMPEQHSVRAGGKVAFKHVSGVKGRCGASGMKEDGCLFKRGVWEGLLGYRCIHWLIQRHALTRMVAAIPERNVQ